MHEVIGFIISCLALNQNRVDILIIEVTHSTFDQIVFLIDQRGRCGSHRFFANVIPKPQKILIVALDLGLCALGTRSPDDKTHTFGYFQISDDCL